MHNTGESKADLHVHSKYSDRPSEWFLRRIGAPESYVEPAELYRRCRAAGMDYVTISDHNCIRGAIEIADLPGTFISAELTTYFPDSGCKIHCLVNGITARHFGELQDVRRNIFELRDYLVEHTIIHSITHPLYRVNDRLTVSEFEKLLVLFNRFEIINGARNGRACAMARAIMQALDEETLGRLADRHGLQPAGATPWIKRFTGGSDDHGGLYAGGAFTRTPRAETVFDYLENLREGRHEPGGTDGSSLHLANSLVHIAHAYIRNRLSETKGGTGLVAALFKNLAGAAAEPTAPVNPVRAAARRLVAPMLRRQKLRQMPAAERLLIEEFRIIAGGHATPPAGEPNLHLDRFDLIARLAHQLSFVFLGRCVEQLKEGSMLDAVQSLASLSPLLIGLAPYVTAFSSQHKDMRFLREVSETYPAARGALMGRGGKAWITDTLNDVNGVAKTVCKLASIAHASGTPITILTSLPEDPDVAFPTRNFKPVGAFPLPEYPELTAALPPFLDIVKYIEEQDFAELIVSTPGPMGLCALFAAALLGLPVKGIYHTDFPQYVEKWTEDESMGELTKRYMRWFYGRMALIYAPTQAYLEELVLLGFERSRLDVLPRGVDLEEFNPGRRQEGFWNRFGLNGAAFRFVYVGRVSTEKNIDVMMDAFRSLRAEGHSVELGIVGGGPELPRMIEQYGDLKGVAFTGYLHGDDLAAAYTGSHALVFPSLTDTFGNVVLEAHACGLPAIVSDRGGPQEIVRSHDSGLVCNAATAPPLLDAMRTMLLDEPAYETFRRNALTSASLSRWDSVLAKL